MQSLKTELIGALVGLARATDGNEHLISKDSTTAILTCLNAAPSNQEELHFYLNLVDEVKQKMVPDCFHCANPCGRTSAYDLSALDKEPPEIQQAKLAILSRLYALAKDDENPDRSPLLYRGLIALGLDGYTAEELINIFPY